MNIEIINDELLIDWLINIQWYINELLYVIVYIFVNDGDKLYWILSIEKIDEFISWLIDMNDVHISII